MSCCLGVPWKKTSKVYVVTDSKKPANKVSVHNTDPPRILPTDVVLPPPRSLQPVQEHPQENGQLDQNEAETKVTLTDFLNGNKLEINQAQSTVIDEVPTEITEEIPVTTVEPQINVGVLETRSIQREVYNVEIEESSKMSVEIQEIPKISVETKEIPKMSVEAQEIPKNSVEMQEVQKISTEAPGIPKMSVETQEMSVETHSKMSVEVPKITVEIQEIEEAIPKISIEVKDTSRMSVEIEEIAEEVTSRSRGITIEDEGIEETTGNHEEIVMLESEIGKSDDEIAIESEIMTNIKVEETDSEESRTSTVSLMRNRRGGFMGETVKDDVEVMKYPKSPEEEAQIKDALISNAFLKNILKEDQVQAMIEAMSPRDTQPFEIIIEQGDKGDHLYVSDSGRFEIIINDDLFDTFNDKRIFGELAILYNVSRMATIKAVTKGRVWILHRQVYQQITILNAKAEREELLSFLKKVPAINRAPDLKLQKISNLLRPEFYQTDIIIVKQGDRGDKFYIIKAGTVTVSVNGSRVTTMGRGQFFGERALLAEDRRQATVIADSPGVECLVLTRKDFIDNLGDLTEFLDTEEEPPTDRPSVVEVRSEYDYIELNQFKRVKTLGIGGFGRVELVQHKQKQKLVFALKYLKKHHMLEKEQREHAFNEKNIQISCHSPFIVRLYKTYQDRKYLYYLLESCLGGDLWSLLQKQKGRSFSDENAKFLAGCILEALAYLHDRHYIYRDLKPENMLIDAAGYVKLTDFGFAKKLKDGDKSYTFAGTPEYVAPEIIYSRGHDKAVDYWAYGVFIFELLVGKTPFRTNDPIHMKTYNLIVKGIDNVVFPTKVPKHAQQIIKKLCKSIPNERLGCQKDGPQAIRDHKWFTGFSWEKLRAHKMKPGFIPKQDGYTDTRYFEEFKEDTDTPPDVDDDLWEGF